MNMKAIALLMSLAMVFAATAVVLVDDAGAAPEDEDGSIDKGTVYVAVGGTNSFDIVITEPDRGYYDNVVSWKVGNSDIYGIEVPVSVGDNSATIIIKDKTDGNKNGNYVATITGVSATSEAETVDLVYTVTTSIKDNTQSGSASASTENGTVKQTLNYKVTFAVIDSNLNPEFSISGNVGTPIQRESVVKNSSDDDYVYYAIGLPKGLQMTPDGYVSGIPTETTDKDAKFTVIETHVASNLTYYFEYDIDINEAISNNFKYKVENAEEITADSTGTEGKYIVVQDNTTVGDVTVITQIVDAETAMPVDAVYVTDSKGVQQNIVDPTDNTTGEYPIPFDGSGSYRVVMVNGDVVKSFELVVVAITYDVSPGIGFSPGTAVPST